MNLKRSLTLLVLVLAGFGFFQNAHASSIITEIETRGNVQVSRQAVLTALTTKVGSPYSASDVRHDLETLYRMGTFGDIRVEKSSARGGIKLIFVFEERTKISKVIFQGNKKIKEEKLRELTDVKPYSPMDDIKMASSIKKIRDKYAEEGYHLAEVTTELKNSDNPQSPERELIFHIREGEAIRIGRVQFLGNKVFSDNELKKKIKSREKGYWSWLASGGKYQEEMLKRDVALLGYHYQNNGYLKVKVSPPKTYLSRDRRWVTLTFHVEEGEKYKIGKVGFEGDILRTEPEMRSHLKAKTGDVYTRKRVEEDLLYLSALYGDQAYAFANINPVIQPDDEKKTADIIYSIRKGIKVTIEKINISGNQTTRDKVLRRELLVHENSPYNETALRQSKERLEALGYFEEVNFATPRGSSDDQIVVNIQVKEKATGTFTIGAGFSSVENFIFNASVSKDNFFGTGISGQLSTELSSKRQYFILSFEDPYFLDSNWILGVSGFRTVNAFDDFDRKSFGGSLTLGHRILDNSVFRTSYQLENVDVDNFRTTVPAIFTKNLNSITSSATLTLQRDTRNNRLFPTKGLYNSLSTEFAGLGGDNDYFRVIENFRFYQPIWKGLVGKFNFIIGQISSLNTLPVPLSERFFMGGVNSLRGFDLRAIGPSVRIPVTPQGGDNRFVYGGNKTLSFNVELEAPIYEPAGFRFVTFVDAGNAFGEDEKFSLTQLRSNYGFGIRWNSPLGPMRFEWGFPFSRNPGESRSVFNFTIGSFF